jgi:apolipoprotein N-acyltransferase
MGYIAHSQYESLTLLQLLSVTGPYGITFLIGWFTAVADSLCEAGLSVHECRAAQPTGRPKKLVYAFSSNAAFQMLIQRAEAQTSTLAKLSPPHTTAHKLRH